MGTLNSWDITDANNNATPPDGWPENTMQYSEVNDTGRAVQGTLKRFFADINGSLAAAGAVNAYTLSLNETGYTAYFEGMYFACSIPITNTGATTINVNAIGAQSVVTQSGSALAGGELVANGIYVFRYDGTDFQLMGSLGSSVGTQQGTFSNANAPDLVDTNVALRVGAADPDTSPHIEVGPGQIQAKDDATTATGFLVLQNAGGDVELRSGGGRRFTTTIDGYIEAYADVNGDPDAGSVSIETALDFYSADSNFFGSVGFGDSPDLALTNSNVGGNIELIGESSVGVFRNVFLGDPTGAADLYHAGSERLSTQSLGISVRSGTGTSSTRRIEFYDNDGTTLRASVGQVNPGRLEITNEINNQRIRLEGRDSGGTMRTLFEGWPGNQVELAYGAFAQALVTKNGAGTAASTYASVRSRDGNSYDVGYNVVPQAIENVAYTFAVEDTAKVVFTTGGVGAFTTPASTDNDFGNALFLVTNLRGSSISINAGSGVTLVWLDGAGGTTGNRTLADRGVCNVYRRTATEWWIWGVGLS